MAIPDDSKPALAVGCRLSGSPEEPILLFPEGAIKVKGTGATVLGLCDGQRTWLEILAELQRLYAGGDPQKIREDTERFLEQLSERRVLNL
jgi:pyrroloquinoline quinone biosynthesis protein D